MSTSRVAQARRMRESGMSQVEIAEILGVGRTTLNRDHETRNTK
jgi:predicted transcriptional regulator